MRNVSTHSYVARQAIVGIDHNTIGYELLFRDGASNSYPNIPADSATSRLIAENQLDNDIRTLVGPHRAFINFTGNSLQEKFPLLFASDQIVVEILESVEPDQQVTASCKELRDLGYCLALDDYDFDSKWDRLLTHVEIIKIDISDFSPEELRHKIREKSLHRFELLAERVETRQQFETCLSIGFKYFQGYYFSKPEIRNQKRLPGNKLSMLELLAEASKRPMDYPVLAAKLQRDASLSYRLLRFINSPLVGLNSTVNSIQQAISLLGEDEIGKFLALLAMAQVGNKKPAALITLVATRARFCELMMTEAGKQELAQHAFLCGLLSLLEAMLDTPLDTLVPDLPVAPGIKASLLGEPGPLLDALNIATAFESADWERVDLTCQQLGIDSLHASHIQCQAMEWACELEALAS